MFSLVHLPVSFPPHVLHHLSLASLIFSFMFAVVANKLRKLQKLDWDGVGPNGRNNGLQKAYKVEVNERRVQ